jgi:pimeloyl-ACP methyl ester carboxylesterase
MKTIRSRDGTVLAYDVYGSGPALIYITGATCFRSFMPIVQDAKALSCFYKGIGMPKLFVLLMPLMPGWKTMKALAPTLAYDIELTCDLPPVARISELSVPIHIIVGEKSPSSIQNVAKQLTQALPDATFTKVIGQDHMVNSKSLLPILVKFLK